MPLLKMPDPATYDPDRVLDAIIARLRLTSKIRHNTLPIGATILLRRHEVSDFSSRELRALMVRADAHAQPA